MKQLTGGLPIAGRLAEPGVYPERPRPDPELDPRQLLKCDMPGQARSASATDPHGGHLWEDALKQVGKGWLDGPCPFDVDGNLVTGEGLQPANPAFRFGAQHEGGGGAESI